MLTLSEQQRLIELEQAIQQVKKLVSNASSKNSLNQLYVLFQEEFRKMDERLTPLETKIDELITEVDKLQ